MNSNALITVDPEILGGTPVFKGTRVPVKTLFEYLEDNYTLEEFLECFPQSVVRWLAASLKVPNRHFCSRRRHENPVGRMCPWPMHKLLSGHACMTVQQRGWGGIKNGELLSLAEQDFDCSSLPTKTSAINKTSPVARLRFSNCPLTAPSPFGCGLRDSIYNRGDDSG